MRKAAKVPNRKDLKDLEGSIDFEVFAVFAVCIFCFIPPLASLSQPYNGMIPQYVLACQVIRRGHQQPAVAVD